MEASEPTVFAYSYAALGIFTLAKDRGWKTVLGQIDPGPLESQIVLNEFRRLGLQPGFTSHAPQGYWEDWRQECDLADHIIVNSNWSAKCLRHVGISAGKLHIVPCAFERGLPRAAAKKYPPRFSSSRPLRVLFLGQTSIRKGVHLLIEAAQRLAGSPLEFTVVGTGSDFDLPRLPANVKWVGPVTRAKTDDYYRDADLFILPTLSDGFGLVQLEAMHWRLPIATTPFCGDVVVPSVNGILMQSATIDCVVEALKFALNSPASLEDMSKNSAIDSRFSLSALASSLLAL